MNQRNVRIVIYNIVNVGARDNLIKLYLNYVSFDTENENYFQYFRVYFFYTWLSARF